MVDDKNLYVAEKIKYAKEDINFMYVFFENGDYVEIKGSEIVNLSINTYDKLIRSYKGYNPIAESGYIKFKISDKRALTNLSHVVYNEKDYKNNRKTYIENRCINEDSVREIWLFDRCNCHNVLHCNVKVKMEDEFLIFEFINNEPSKSFSSKNHYVNIGSIKKENIHSIDLDFENCESFVVYKEEILEVNLAYDKSLKWAGSDLNREIVGGYIRVKLNKDYGTRENHLFDNDKAVKVSDFEKRLCNKNKITVHDICHLYVRYANPGYVSSFVECLCVDDIKSDEEIEMLERKEEDEGLRYYEYESGYCKKNKGHSIVIAFGKNAKETIMKLCK